MLTDKFSAMKLPKSSGLTLLFSLLVFSLWAQPNFAPTAAENSLLWEISGNNLRQPSYLFGTIHMIPASDFFLSESVKRAFNASSTVTFEIDTENMDNPMMLFSMLGSMTMKNDTTLRDLLTQGEYIMVKNHFDQLGLPLSMLEQVKPIFLSVLASDDMGGAGSEMSLDGMKSYELELTSMAKESNKKVEGLESIAYQLSLFDSIPYAAQAKMLVEAVSGGDRGASEEEADPLDELIGYYKNENIIKLQALVEDEEGIAGFQNVLLTNRNRNWIEPMAKMMRRETVFFAVGAGHLAGSDGLVALLRAAGYQLKPLRD
jgi:uncharacterized protein YbaP (TraB family)